MEGGGENLLEKDEARLLEECRKTNRRLSSELAAMESSCKQWKDEAERLAQILEKMDLDHQLALEKERAHWERERIAFETEINLLQQQVGSNTSTNGHLKEAREMSSTAKLHKAEIPWTRLVLRQSISAKDELCYKFKAILNKLTPQKFQALSEQALQLDIDTMEKMAMCVDLIVNKAQKEPHYSATYAQLSKVMSPIKVVDGENRVNFRRLLLTRVQENFLKKDDGETLDETQRTEMDEICHKLGKVSTITMRKLSMGNTRFIGELFVLKMLSETIIHDCVTRLLQSSTDEEALEHFGTLMSTVGKDLDDLHSMTRMNGYFRRIADIIKKRTISNRIWFILLDIQELRENDWVPRARQDKQLKTIDQIHAEAKLEEKRERKMIFGRGGWQERNPGQKEIREKFDQNKIVGILSRHRKEKIPGNKKKSVSSTSQSHGLLGNTASSVGTPTFLFSAMSNSNAATSTSNTSFFQNAASGPSTLNFGGSDIKMESPSLPMNIGGGEGVMNVCRTPERPASNIGGTPGESALNIGGTPNLGGTSPVFGALISGAAGTTDAETFQFGCNSSPHTPTNTFGHFSAGKGHQQQLGGTITQQQHPSVPSGFQFGQSLAQPVASASSQELNLTGPNFGSQAMPSVFSGSSNKVASASELNKRIIKKAARRKR